MTESHDLTLEADNKFIPKYIPEDLKWYEKDRLDTWFLRNFKKRHIVNFDMIKNNPSQETIKQYQTIDHDEIKRYPIEYQDQIRSSIFRNADRKDMFIEKKL